MSKYSDDSSCEFDGDNDQSKGRRSADSNAINELLRDPKKKELVLAKLGLNDDPKPTHKDSRKRDTSNDNSNQHLTLSGKTGAWSMPPPLFGSWQLVVTGHTRRAPSGWPYVYGSFPPTNPADPHSSKSVDMYDRICDPL